MAAIDPRREALRNAGVFIVDGIEFIRKSTLLKWLQEARAIPHDGALIRDRAFQEVINYINEM